MAEFIGYYRVSTKRQGRSGLGLEAQQSSVRQFSEANGELVAEYQDIESGRNDDRPGLNAAIAEAKKRKAILLVARLDRFSRRVSFISWLMEQGVDLKVVEMPNASTFQLHIHGALAEEERRMISERTKAALKAAKKRGVVLGRAGAERARQNREHAQQFSNGLIEKCRELNIEGMGYSEIARCLNKVGVLGAKGGRLYPSTIKNYVESTSVKSQCEVSRHPKA